MAKQRYVTYCRVIFSMNLHEYQVKAYDQDDERMPEADYYTDDREDAHNTACAMVKRGKELRFDLDNSKTK